MNEILDRTLRGRSVAVLYLNFGPYHVARLRAVAAALASYECKLIGVELASFEDKYPWRIDRGAEPFTWVTLFPDRTVESVSKPEQRRAICALLDGHDPAAVAPAGWSHAFFLAALGWCRRRRAVSVVCGDSTAHTGLRGDWTPIRRPWHKELVKRFMLRGVNAAQASGNLCREYFASLGIPRERIVLKYDVVDNAFFSAIADAMRADADAWRTRLNLPPKFFFYPSRMLVVKNHLRLLAAYEKYAARAREPWGLVLLGSGPDEAPVDERIRRMANPLVSRRPNEQIEGVARYYGLASALVFPSWSETWGLIINEAEAAGLPVIVSSGCTAAEHLLVEGVNGFGFDPMDVEGLAAALGRMASLSAAEYSACCATSRRIIAEWDVGPHAAELLRAIGLGAATCLGVAP